ncbi:hypothetical protein GW17_00049034 [Ensete ventricosum]|nr:hypothetical protein GW17_00049034 [Ensete ventricosum]
MRTGRSVALLFLVLVEFLGWKSRVVEAKPRRIVLDTDMDTDDFFALLYLLKQNPSQFDLKVRFSPFPPAITISANAWTDAGHAVNHVYDILYMMNRDDIPVGVGGDGGILDDGTILPHVGGYLPLIEQVSISTGLVQCFLITSSLSFGLYLQSYFMWDSFASGVAISIMSKADNYDGENEFAEMKYLNITVVTSNEPYGVRDGSNPFFHGRAVPKFNLKKAGVHSGHVQTGLQDPFCIVKGSDRGICQVARTFTSMGVHTLHSMATVKTFAGLIVSSGELLLARRYSYIHTQDKIQLSHEK